MKIHKAFTLAEVLITLGVIGVVAALTMPALIKEYQKHVWVNQLKTTYSILNQGFQKMMADSGVDNVFDTDAWRKGNNICDVLKNYFKIECNVKLNDYDTFLLNGDVAGRATTATTMTNGALILSSSYLNNIDEEYNTETCNNIYAKGGHMCGFAGNLEIDINGSKGPNTIGRDIFIFNISDKGLLVANGSFDCATYWNVVYGEDMYLWNTESCVNSESDGFGCAARIIENGWKMDY